MYYVKFHHYVGEPKSLTYVLVHPSEERNKTDQFPRWSCQRVVRAASWSATDPEFYHCMGNDVKCYIYSLQPDLFLNVKTGNVSNSPKTRVFKERKTSALFRPRCSRSLHLAKSLTRRPGRGGRVVGICVVAICTNKWTNGAWGFCLYKIVYIGWHLI